MSTGAAPASSSRADRNRVTTPIAAGPGPGPPGPALVAAADVLFVRLEDEVSAPLPMPSEPGQQVGALVADAFDGVSVRPREVVDQLAERHDRDLGVVVLGGQPGDGEMEPGCGAQDVGIHAVRAFGRLDVVVECGGQPIGAGLDPSDPHRVASRYRQGCFERGDSGKELGAAGPGRTPPV